jgi:predicted ATP-grasp superfamily ATP-dependent carboligase
MSMGMKPVIVIFTHTVGLAVIRALGERGVPIICLYYRDSEMGHVSRYVQKKIQVPSPVHAEEQFLRALIELAPAYRHSLLIPTDDYTVVSLSKNKSILEDHFVVAAERWDLVSTIIRKYDIYARAVESGVPCPKTFLPDSLQSMADCCEDIAYPCLMKPLEGHKFFDSFREKVFKVQSSQDLYTKFRSLEKAGLQAMIQEIIPGQDSQNVNYNSYFINGQPVAEFTARKVRIEPPFFGSPRVLVSEYIPEVIEPGRRLLQRIGFNGFSCMEFKQDERDKQYKLMEINCRSNLTGLLAVRCGINFPWIMYRHLVYGEVKTGFRFREGVYWIDLLHDVKRCLGRNSQERYRLSECLRPYLHKHIFAVFSLKDPLPFCKRLSYVLKSCQRSAMNQLSGKAGSVLAKIK